MKIRVPCPEVAGLIHAVGYGVTEWKEEQLVGVGWHGEHWPMQSCRCEDFFACCNEQMTDYLYEGYAYYKIVQLNL